jgi:hypothetical protein
MTPDLHRAETQARQIKLLVWSAVVILGGLQAWASRYHISSEDGVAYLDIGDAYWRGDWANAINGQWSPAYSWILGLALKILQPSSYWEFPVVKLVNFSIYLFVFGCFEFFLRRLRRFYLDQIAQSENLFTASETEWWLLGYALFLWFALEWVKVSSDTPDLLTAGFVFLSTGILLNLKSSKRQWLEFSLFGILLGLSYLCKTVMFPLSLVLLAISLFSIASFSKALPLTFAALLFFIVTTAPFIAALSYAKGHLTFGETGKLNYAWFVNPGEFIVPDHHWQGGPPDSGMPEHPTRRIFDDPAAFEFAGPIGGTYAPWYDPTYWYQGVKTKFDIAQHVRLIVKNGRFYFQHFLAVAIFIALLLIAFSDGFASSVRELLRKSWKLLIPAAAGLTVYMLDSDLELNFFISQPDTRYIAVFVVLLFAGLFVGVPLPDGQASRRLVSGLTFATVVTMGSFFLLDVSEEIKYGRSTKPLDWQVSEGLKALSIPPGTAVANLDLRQYYWARLGRLRIVAEVPDALAFWAASSATRAQVLQNIRDSGARAVVQKPSLSIPSRAVSEEGWREIGTTGAYVYKF